MKINIIGRGNVASHLIKAYEGVCEIVAVNPHTLNEFDTEAEISLISVADSAIASVIYGIPETKGILAHTSGSTGMSVFSGRTERHGVFYPLQTFTKDKSLDYSRIPFFIEGDCDETSKTLSECARLVSTHVYEADSEKRRILHVASVFACNFVNHLWAIADGFLDRNGLDFSMLQPLIEETAAKIKSVRPAAAQTGPASRGDLGIISSHLEMLEGDTDEQEIYRLLSDSIMKSKNSSKSALT